MKITTSRLILRNWQAKDAKDWSEITKQKEVVKWIYGVKYNSSIEKAKKVIIEDEKKTGAIYRAILEKSSGKIIGSVWFIGIDEEHERKIAELGVLLRKEFWNKGYATEACKALINFGFKKLKFLKIIAKVNIENKTSEKMIKKLGFKFEGRLRKQILLRFKKKWCDELNYGLLKGEWKNK